MSDSDGQSPINLLELLMVAGLDSESGKATTQTQPHQSLNDVRCRIFAFIGGAEPHFMFAGENGEFGRFYVTNQQIALCVEDGTKHIGDSIIVRKGK